MDINSDMRVEEKEAIVELRKRMKGDMEPEMYEDTHLFFRFLKARDFNMDNAEAMLRKHIIWREQNDVKNIMKFTRSEVIEKYFVYPMFAYDKEGCVVRYAATGSLDVSGVMASLSSDEVRRSIIYECEAESLELKKQREKLGKNIQKCVYIYNLKDLSFAVATDKRVVYMLIQLMHVFVDNYPERLKGAYILNVSMYFNILFSALKTILPMTVLNKVHLYSDESYKEDLLKIIDADVLPAFLGGSRTDPDGNPECLTIIPHPEKVPHSYYLQRRKRSLSNAPGVQKLILSSAAFHEVNLGVEEPGSHIEWEFETKSRDIGFGLFYSEEIEGEEKNTELIAIQRIDTEEHPETGTFTCENSGKYIIVFDNTYSWVRRKEIYYRTKIVTPKKLETEINA